jgi:type II secretory pathway predicted ATPase ExeA
MTTRTARSMDPANPPVGTRLNVSRVATALKVSFSDMQAATGVSRGALFAIADENRWPGNHDPAKVRQAVEALMAERGATPEQLASLWSAYSRATRIGPTDSQGRPLAPTAQRQAPGGNGTRRNEDTDMLLAKQTLSAEARKHFAMFTNPFDGEVTCSDEMFSNGEIRFVREACWQAATGGRFVAVVGESGAGKTTLLADLKERITTDRKPSVVIEPSVLGMEENDSRGKVLKAGDILTAICMTLAPNTPVAQTSEKRTRQAEKLLAGSTTAGNSHLLLIEEAHALPVATLKHLKRLHERMRLNGRKPMLGILLLGQPELLDTLSDRKHDVREVVQRVELVQLQPLDHDLGAYLGFRARAASRDLNSLLAPEAVDALRARLTVMRQGVRNSAVSMVYPLAVNNLVTACLNLAAKLGVPVVTADVVEAV